MKRKRAFSLLEIIISIAILALIASSISIGATRLMRYHRYKSEVQEITTLFINAQKLAKTLDQSFTISIENKKNDGSSFVEIRVIEPSNDHLTICKFHKRLEGITAIYSSYEKKKLFNKKISFFPTGEVLPEVNLYFYAKNLSNLEGLEMRNEKIEKFNFSNEK